MGTDLEHSIMLALVLVLSATQAGIASVGSFNIQVFGTSKLEDAEVTSTLVKIIRSFDMMAVMEIRDSQGTAFPTLIEEVNKGLRTTSRYDYVIGPRLGRTNSKEQYAFVYRTSHFQVLGSDTFPDPNDWFERPPLVVHFAFIGADGDAVFDFIAIVVHTKPSANTYLEIAALENVYEQYSRAFGTENGVILGDFNADCSYMPKYRWADVNLRQDNRFLWLIDDDDDTTIATSSCAYDRIVLAGEMTSELYIDNSAEPYYYPKRFSINRELAVRVSDHLPVWMKLSDGKTQAYADQEDNGEIPDDGTGDDDDDDQPNSRNVVIWVCVLVGVAVVVVSVIVVVKRKAKISPARGSKPQIRESLLASDTPSSSDDFLAYPRANVKELTKRFEQPQ